MSGDSPAVSRRGFIGATGLAAGLAVGASAVAGATQVQSERPRVRVILLGTGSPAPSLKRQSAGYLIQVGDEVILLDHGGGAHHRLLEAGYRAVDVTHLFLSHLHYDHMIDYPRLLVQRWDQAAGNRPELKVYGPAPIKRITETLLGPDGLLGPDLEARVNHQASKDVFVARGGTLPRLKPAPQVTELKRGDVFEGNGWRMRIGEAEHHQPLLNCFNFRLETPDGSLAYSGDSGAVPESLIENARGCDLLIHMCHFPSGVEPTAEFRRTTGSHMDIAQIAARAGVKALVLSHMTPLVDRPGVKERMLVEIAQVYKGPVVLGEDLMEIPFTISFPTKID